MSPEMIKTVQRVDYIPSHSYYGNTPVLVKINEDIKYISLKKLFATYSDKAQKYENNAIIDTKNLQKEFYIHPSVLKNTYSYQKAMTSTHINLMPKEKISIQVWNQKDGWTDCLQLIKHINKKDFILFQIKSGDFVFTTTDQLICMADGSKKIADELTINDEIIKNTDINLPHVPETLIIPDELAYFTGFILGDGSIKAYDYDFEKKDRRNSTGVYFTRGGNAITIYQNNIDDSYIKKITDKVFDKPNYFKVTDKSDRTLNFSSYDYNYLATVLFDYSYRENSFTKHLPCNIMSWTKESKESFIAGLIDSDGSIFTDELNRISIRLMSYATINALSDVLSTLPGVHAIYKRIDGMKIDSCIYEVTFKVTKESNLINLSQKVKKAFKNNSNLFNTFHEKYSKANRSGHISKIIKFNEAEIKETRFLKQEIQEVYGIITSTGYFYANGLSQLS